jgi:hypothetical protein
MGSVIRVRRTQGLGQLDNPRSIAGAAIPPTIGGAVTAATTVGIRMMQPKTETQINMMRNAPLIGIGAGLVTSLLLGWSLKPPAGWSSAAATTAVGGALLVSEYYARESLKKVASGETVDAMKPYGLGRMGAVVMEPHASRGYGRGPMGAIVPEYSNTRGLSGHRTGAYGDVVNLGSVNPNAFGTPGFRVAGAR